MKYSLPASGIKAVTPPFIFMKGDDFVEAASEVGRAPKLGLHREVLTFEPYLLKSTS